MTVKELIEKLSQFPQDAEVFKCGNTNLECLGYDEEGYGVYGEKSRVCACHYDLYDVRGKKLNVVVI